MRGGGGAPLPGENGAGAAEVMQQWPRSGGDMKDDAAEAYEKSDFSKKGRGGAS